MIENSNLWGLSSFAQITIPFLITNESKKIDDILKRILEIRQQPKDMQAELASDLIADITKNFSRDFIEKMQNPLVSCI